MRKLTSNYVFSKESGLLKQAIIEIEDNKVKAITDTVGDFKEVEGLEYYSGLLIVGDLLKNEFIKLKHARSLLTKLFEHVKSTSDSVHLITKLDYENMKLKDDSEIKRYL